MVRSSWSGFILVDWSFFFLEHQVETGQMNGLGSEGQKIAKGCEIHEERGAIFFLSLPLLHSRWCIFPPLAVSQPHQP